MFFMKLMKGLFEMNLINALKIYVILIPIVIMGVGLLAVYLHNNI